MFKLYVLQLAQFNLKVLSHEHFQQNMPKFLEPIFVEDPYIFEGLHKKEA
jgi:hypothetical protein